MELDHQRGVPDGKILTNMVHVSTLHEFMTSFEPPFFCSNFDRPSPLLTSQLYNNPCGLAQSC